MCEAYTEKILYGFSITLTGFLAAVFLFWGQADINNSADHELSVQESSAPVTPLLTIRRAELLDNTVKQIHIFHKIKV